jgi:integrase
VRPAEATGAEIGELADIENGERTRLEIPADRMKGRRAHVVPLAQMALGIVREQLSRATLGQEHIFSSHFENRGSIARHSLSQGLRRIIEGLNPAGPDANTVTGLKARPPTPHDFRRTVATGLAALGVPREDRLAILAHTLRDVHGVHYDKYDRMNEKFRALEAWEQHIAKIIGSQEATSSNIVKIGERR